MGKFHEYIQTLAGIEGMPEDFEVTITGAYDEDMNEAVDLLNAKIEHSASELAARDESLAALTGDHEAAMSALQGELNASKSMNLDLLMATGADTSTPGDVIEDAGDAPKTTDDLFGYPDED